MLRIRYGLFMERKTFSLRLPPKLYDALSTLSGVAHRSMNELISEAVQKYVVTESEAQAQDIEKTLQRLRAYRESDPDFKQAFAEFVDAEVSYDDPLEGEPYEVESPVRSKVQSLLTDA